MKHKKCLVLNADYTPIGIISWQKAMVWLFRIKEDTNNIDIIEYHANDSVLTCRGPERIPSVVKTIKYFKLLNHHVNFSRKNVFIRDDFRCQYCNKKYAINELTYDHVIPRAQWKCLDTPTCWTNIVTACWNCNEKKGNKTPQQANMPLIKEPYIPRKTLKYLPLAHQLNTILTDLPKEWHSYIGDLIG